VSNVQSTASARNLTSPYFSRSVSVFQDLKTGHERTGSVKMKGLSAHSEENSDDVRSERRGMALLGGILVVYGRREVCVQRNGQ